MQQQTPASPQQIFIATPASPTSPEPLTIIPQDLADEELFGDLIEASLEAEIGQTGSGTSSGGPTATSSPEPPVVEVVELKVKKSTKAAVPPEKLNVCQSGVLFQEAIECISHKYNIFSAESYTPAIAAALLRYRQEIFECIVNLRIQEKQAAAQVPMVSLQKILPSSITKH